MSFQQRGLALMGGRGQKPLSEQQIRRVSDTFTGLDSEMRNVRYDKDSRTVFRVVGADESVTGEEHGEIVFGPDIYPGTGVAHPNALLSYRAAAAHELTHYHRWANMTQLNGEALEQLDEACTSLEAIQRYGRKLDRVEIDQLVGDALYRLALFRTVGLPSEEDEKDGEEG